MIKAVAGQVNMNMKECRLSYGERAMLCCVALRHVRVMDEGPFWAVRLLFRLDVGVVNSLGE